MQAMSVVMHLNSVETLTSPYLEVALRGCLFLGGGWVSSGLLLCLFKNIHEAHHWKAL